MSVILWTNARLTDDVVVILVLSTSPRTPSPGGMLTVTVKSKVSPDRMVTVPGTDTAAPLRELDTVDQFCVRLQDKVYVSVMLPVFCSE